MKILLSIITILILSTIVIILKINELKNIKYIQPEILSNKKILIAYYSNGGNTKSVANNLQSVIGADIKEIKLIEKYPDNVFKMSKLVREQIKEGYIPETENINISDYEIIFIGSPVWNLSLSLPVKSFLKNNNFENKTLIPFFTYSGGVNRSKIINEFKDLTNSNDIKKPLFMFENGIFLVKEQIIKWLNKIS